MKNPTVCLCLLLLAYSAGSAQASETSSAGADFFEKRIRPVLVERCFECHSAAKEAKGKLLLDSHEGMIRGGEGGPIIVLGDPDKSRLITALRYTDSELEMPPKHALSPDQVHDFEHWVKIGAPDPRKDVAAAIAKLPPSYDYVAARKFWCFQPVMDSPVPQVVDKSWPMNDVDAFIAAQYEAKHLQPVPAADKRTLIRRATFDLTGLPPTVEEVEAFVADGSTDAFAKVVDRLLALPAYGEKWGRHWLDLVRYADTAGCNSDFPVPDAYRYRNWVISAFNRDEPYDQFLTEQLAGDLLPARDAAERHDHVIATGYLAIARRFGSSGTDFHLTIEDVIDNLGKTMLGLSINCARCHDHKFDPIPNSDYYALYGIFASTKFAFPGVELYPHPKDFTPLCEGPEAAAFRKYEKTVADLDEHLQHLKLERDILASREKSLRASPATHPSNGAATHPAVRTSAQVLAEIAAGKEQLKNLEATRPHVEKAYAVYDGNPVDAAIQIKGDPLNLGPKVPRRFLTILGAQAVPRGSAASGRRELAGWIADPRNPLTARVMVNRIWQHHFGVGLVKSPNDFGIRGQKPTNPALLDFLASRFVSSGWSIKSMHRLIMLSHVYQLGSDDTEANAAIDPPNDYFWRQNARRLSAEEIRDSLLAVSNTLDRAPGGPHPFAPEEQRRYTQHHPFVGDFPTNHRSVYLMQQRIRKQPFLAVFDGADTNADTGDRALSTTPLQALFMMNDPLMRQTAVRLAERVSHLADDDAGRISRAISLCFSRPATPDEARAGCQYLDSCGAKLLEAGISASQRNLEALSSYMHVLLSSDEFVFVD